MLSDDAARLLRRAIKSVWALELLILLRRDRRAWTVAEITRELRFDQGGTTAILAILRAQGLVEQLPDGAVRYQPAAPDLEAAADEIHRAYDERPLGLIKEIASTPDQRLQSFADAFKLKRD